jgi:chemotaxis protein MotB
MSNGQQEDVSSQPLVIVRRRRNVDEPHHGGVWKIAYADFMTAMMAFFLVMWLINAADKKTIVQVAAYFNPMRLTDRYAAPKGLEDLTETESKPSDKKNKRGFEKQADDKRQLDAVQESKDTVGEAMDEAAQKTSTAVGGKADEQQKEEALFDNPGDLLEKLADQAKGRQPTTTSNPTDGNVSDPFDRVNRKSGKSKETLKPATQVAAAPKIETPEITPEIKTPSIKAPDANTPNVKLEDAKAADATVPAVKPTDIKSPEDTKPAVPTIADKNEKQLGKEAEAKKIEADISSAISKISRVLPNVEVKATPEGVLISLIDDANFGMFEVGSAQPRPELVLVMDKVGDVLKDTPGKIVIRGHTDSRAYKNGNYDNWRLSAARAQMAYYMLVRGGIAESNFIAIEGRADRDPKVPSDTTAAQNRRIDILIKDAQP